MMTTDETDMRSARDAVLYSGKKNSLIEWTLSPEWTQPSEDSGKHRGFVQRDSGTWYGHCNSVDGEIENAR